MEFHDAANIFPLDKAHINELAADIKQHGQKLAIQLLDGKVIDGRRRWTACEIARVKPKTEVIETDDPIAHVMSLNDNRRHLSPTQRGMAAGRARKMYDKAAKERQRLSEGRGVKGKESLPDLNQGQSRDQAGKALGVSGKLVDAATKVLEKGSPELIAAADEDRISVSRAAKLADETPEVQKHAAETARKTGGRYRPPKIKDEPRPEPEAEPKSNGRPPVGVILAHEAINDLKRIPKNDPLRNRGFQIVTDWIRSNK